METEDPSDLRVQEAVRQSDDGALQTETNLCRCSNLFIHKIEIFRDAMSAFRVLRLMSIYPKKSK